MNARQYSTSCERASIRAATPLFPNFEQDSNRIRTGFEQELKRLVAKVKRSVAKVEKRGKIIGDEIVKYKRNIIMG
jgi:uncharacterized protein YtpQ (UPF0354 family)